jgi:hypothetical protein
MQTLFGSTKSMRLKDSHIPYSTKHMRLKDSLIPYSTKHMGMKDSLIPYSTKHVRMKDSLIPYSTKAINLSLPECAGSDLHNGNRPTHTVSSYIVGTNHEQSKS